MNLLYLGSRILPAVCIIGAVHLTVINTLYPMSDEQRRELEELRNRKEPLRSARNKPPAAQTKSETFQEEVLTDKWAQEPSSDKVTGFIDTSGGGADGSSGPQ